MNLSKTKLIITWGPSLDKLLSIDKDKLIVKNKKQCIDGFNQLVDAGIDVIRFNMSHESIENHEFRWKLLKELNSQSIKKIGLMIDTKGPEIRVQNIQKNNLDLNRIKLGDKVNIHCCEPDLIGNKFSFSVSDATRSYNLSKDLSIGDEIFVADGKLVLKVVDIDEHKGIINTISNTNDFIISSNRRINLMNHHYHIPFLSEYDKLTIQKAIEWNVEFIALSFVSNLNEIKSVKQLIQQINIVSSSKIILKIETPQALDNIDELIDNADGVMVARGDLSLEIGYEKVPYWQQKIVNKCHERKKISIIATQMLDSLEINHFPTRAEVNDCYIAAFNSVNSTMLSGETAAGIDPLNTIKVMKKITNFADKIVIDNSTNQNNFLNRYDYVELIGFNELEILDFSLQDTKTKFVIDSKKIDNNYNFCLYKNINILDVNRFKNSLVNSESFYHFFKPKQ